MTLDAHAVKSGRDWLTDRELSQEERLTRSGYLAADVIPWAKGAKGVNSLVKLTKHSHSGMPTLLKGNNTSIINGINQAQFNGLNRFESVHQQAKINKAKTIPPAKTPQASTVQPQKSIIEQDTKTITQSIVGDTSGLNVRGRVL